MLELKNKRIFLKMLTEKKRGKTWNRQNLWRIFRSQKFRWRRKTKGFWNACEESSWNITHRFSIWCRLDVVTRDSIFSITKESHLWVFLEICSCSQRITSWLMSHNLCANQIGWTDQRAAWELQFINLA